MWIYIFRSFFSFVAHRYFSKIDDAMLKDLLQIYGPDFDLFGYNSTKYFDIVKKSSKPPTPINVTTVAAAAATTAITITTV